MTTITAAQLATIDRDGDPAWYAKLKANRALAQQDDRVQAIQRWALENYDRGGATIVEAFEPDEILRDLIPEGATTTEALAEAASFCGLRRDVENDVRGYGGLEPLPTLDR